MSDRAKARSGNSEPSGAPQPDVDRSAASEIRACASDLALVERLRARDEQAFSDLLDRYHAKLLRLALVFVSSRAVAEEVVQETWVGVLDGLAGFEGRSTLETWIFRILTNRAKTRGVREQRTVPFSALSNPEEDHETAVDAARFQPNGMWGIPPRRWEDDTPENLFVIQEALQLLERAIAELSPNQRAVVTLRDIDGLDSDAVCNVLGISETNQRVLLHRARSKLRAALEEYVERK
jgi:RNA polymerase sigma-70 factor (ECF subfamily)